MPYKSKEEQREYQRRWIAERRAAYFEGKTCKCGSNDRLELDHIDPNKKVSHKIWSWTASKRESELAKCQVLCYTCHKAKTKDMVERRFCVRGHDTHVVGRKSSRGCKACAAENERKRRARKEGTVQGTKQV